MDTPINLILTVILILSAGIWIGGYATLVAVSLTTSKTLDPQTRINFFQKFGRTYLLITVPALIVTYIVGWAFLSRLPWSGELTRMAAASVLLVVVLIAGVLQARSLTSTRAQLAANAGDAQLAEKVRRGARTAVILRGLIGFITLGMTVHAASVLTDLL
jgi:hypothetical protein